MNSRFMLSAIVSAATVGSTFLTPGLMARADSQEVTVPERTAITVVLQEELKSGDAKEDAEVPYVIKEDVTDVDKHVLIKAGTPAYGKVTESKRRGMMGKPGKLEFTCDYILMPDRTHIPLRADKQSAYGRDNRGASVATAILLAPIALLVSGRDVTVEKGKEIVMYVDKTTKASNKPAEGTVAAPTASGGGAAKSVFVMADGSVVIGSLSSFDGSKYTVKTDGGTKELKVSEVKSVTPIK